MAEPDLKKYEPDQTASSSCCSQEAENNKSRLQPLGIPIAQPADDEDAPCCGFKPGPPSSPHERPGFRILDFVDDFIETEAGDVPRIKTHLEMQDVYGTVRARLGIYRDRYRVAPGLYGVGSPDRTSPVLVTANYKLSFDSLRQELAGVEAWILVLDTRGVNVWCAAGKRTFSSQEVIRQVERTGLARLVSHRELILPQLGAPGVSAQAVKSGCGFKVIWGPIRAEDLRAFLANGRQAEEKMRRLTFTMGERLVLIPVELSLIVKPSLAVLLAIFVLSGISPDIFSIPAAWNRGLQGAAAYLAGIAAGAVAVPVLLPWLPTRHFYIKGLVSGLGASMVIIFLMDSEVSLLEAATLFLLTMAVSSYAAMNFTGATPFTSPSGVEKEMRQAIPVQAAAMLAATAAWLVSPFIG